MKHITQYLRDKRRDELTEFVFDVLNIIGLICFGYVAFLVLSALEPITK